MPDWKKNNFAWEKKNKKMEVLRIPKETLPHPSRFVQTWCCRNNIYQLGKRFVVGSSQIQSCFANTFLQSPGITEGAEKLRHK